MPVVNVKLLKKEQVANGTMAFHWQKPEGFEFRAGQFCDITLIDPPETDSEGDVRGFSLAYAPYENDIVTATRMRDTAFKRVLKDLQEGTEVKFDAPYGDFTLHKTESTPAVFIIGGIGITPVRSMIAQATHDETSHKITLLFSNKTPADAPFISDLRGFAEANPNFTFVPVYTDAAEAEWDGERGYVDAEILKRHVADLSAPIYYLAGPAGMVKAMRQILVEAGANEDNIRTEEFSGY
ncbi:MAG TPA: FAD-dependent oxidoreductase [Candidatus Saccharimonadales bacterium]|nr:FAD-dependent oxidoreductase [Candidatus Saccharimonadales bacterium]